MLEPGKQHFQLGAALLVKGDLEGSITALREAIRADPGYRVAHYQLGVALARKGANAEAVAAFREALRLDPSYVEAYIDLGEALLEDRVGEANSAFRMAIHLNPHQARAHLGLGKGLRRLGRSSEANSEFHHAIALDPALAEAHVGLGHIRLEQAAGASALTRLLHRRRLLSLEAAAFSAFRHAIRMQPQCASARVGVGDVLLIQGHPLRARAQYQEAIRLGAPAESLQTRLEAAGAPQDCSESGGQGQAPS